MARRTSKKDFFQSLAVPFVCLLIFFLAYGSQYLFFHLDPGPLTRNEAIWFNVFVLGIWWSYDRTCSTDPGRLPDKIANAGLKSQAEGEGHDGKYSDRPKEPVPRGRGRWCKKCEAVKPPRAHHCRQCGRCIPKMDHHCPWTSNCVSHNTLPHFLRFLYFTCTSLLILEYHLSIRLIALWDVRNLPSYLGPSVLDLVLLFTITTVTSLILFGLSILLVTSTKSLWFNTTRIESWEIERHEALVEKARYLGGYVEGPGGRRIRIKRQEFPYDISIWKNIVQGMGTPNVLAWILPFAGGPANESGWGPWEENGFEDEGTTWPPIDPDKLPRNPPYQKHSKNSTNSQKLARDDKDEVQAFKRRQQEDYKRWQTSRPANSRTGATLRSSDAKLNIPPQPARGENASEGNDNLDGLDEDDEEYGEDTYEEGMDGEAGWTNSDGDRLRDYGVDEDTEESENEVMINDEEEDIPLGELLRRRRARVVDGE